MDELSQYLFEPLWAEGEFVLSRSVRDAALAPLLVMAPVLAQPAPESLQRLAQGIGVCETLQALRRGLGEDRGHDQERRQRCIPHAAGQDEFPLRPERLE